MRRLILFISAVFLLLPAVALGDVSASQRHGLALNQLQLWALVIGAFTPLVGYIVNSGLVRKLRAAVPEPVLALIHVVIAAVAAAIYEAATTNSLGFNDATVQVILTAIAASFAAHGFVWKPSGVQAQLVGPPPQARRAHS